MQANTTDMIGNNMERKSKDSQILFRVTDEERAIIQKEADAEDRSISSWVRLLVQRHLAEKRQLPESKGKKVSKP